jgi:hypothetical protein
VSAFTPAGATPRSARPAAGGRVPDARPQLVDSPALPEGLEVAVVEDEHAAGLHLVEERPEGLPGGDMEVAVDAQQGDGPDPVEGEVRRHQVALQEVDAVEGHVHLPEALADGLHRGVHPLRAEVLPGEVEGLHDRPVLRRVVEVQDPRVHRVEEVQAEHPPFGPAGERRGLHHHAAAALPHAHIDEVPRHARVEHMGHLLGEALHERRLHHRAHRHPAELQVVEHHDAVHVLVEHRRVEGEALAIEHGAHLLAQGGPIPTAPQHDPRGQAGEAQGRAVADGRDAADEVVHGGGGWERSWGIRGGVGGAGALPGAPSTARTPEPCQPAGK